jgi:hypothetical protein
LAYGAVEQEEIMRSLLSSAAAVAVILTATGAGLAQQPPQDAAKSSQQDAAETNKKAAQQGGEDTSKLGQQDAGKQGSQDASSQDANKPGVTGGPETRRALGAPDSPPQHQVIGPPNAGPVTLRGDGLDIPGASAETAPAKLSPANNAKDEHPWLDRGLALSDEQKKKIYGQLARDGAKSGAGMAIFAEPAAVVPMDARLYEVPAALASEIPYIKDFKFVVDQNKVVLVDPDNNTVAAVLGAN